VQLAHRARIACAAAAVAYLALPALAAPSEPAVSGADSITAARVETRILAAFGRDAQLRGYDLGVLVAADGVTLSGTVASESVRAVAERRALAAAGEVRVDNRIGVDAQITPRGNAGTGPAAGNETPAADGAISAAIESKLLWNALVQGLDVRVATHAGQVTLAGSAISYAERDMAGIVASDTDGVVGVDNELVLADGKHPVRRPVRSDEPVSDPPPDAWITSRVKSSLQFTRGLGRTAFAVTTNHGIVRISGVVASKADRDLALQVAQDVRGVRQVDADGLTAG
jgi:hyperosmotically inducible periplasmic protein